MNTTKSFCALGTVNTITVFDSGDKALLDRAEAEVLHLDDLWSVFKPDSEISRLNRAAGRAPVPVSDVTLALLDTARRFSLDCGGAFAVTVGPLSRLWRDAIRRRRLPDADAAARAAALVGDGDLVLDPAAGTAFLRRPGMEVDLGSIAKGCTADRVRALLQANGIHAALLNFGGTVCVFGRSARVGLQHPRLPTGTAMGVLPLENSALVTSGDYERGFAEGGRRIHHLIDPRTGRPAASGLCSVSAVGDDAMLLDALTTALFVLGARQGAALLDRCRAEALLVTDDLDVFCTGGLRGRFRLYEKYEKVRNA